MSDDQRATKTLGVMNATRRLFMRGGTSFKNAFATTPACCPARASVFTGQYAHNHGVIGNNHVSHLVQEHTLQRYLQEAGYRTAIFGKYANGWGRRRNPPYFDRWAFFSGGWKYRYQDGLWNVNGETQTVKRYATEFIRRKAVRFIRRGEARDREPWLLYMHPPAPHAPAIPQRRYADRRYATWSGNPAVGEKSRRDKPPYVRRAPPTTLSEGRGIRLRQLRTLESSDDMIRSVFESLSRNGENRRTLAIFLSDNGFLWGEHRLSEKRHAYTQSTGIPLAIRWPGRVSKGKRSGKLVANIDLAPTILDAAHVTSQHTMDGHSLLRSWKRASLLLEHWRTGTTVPTWKSLRSKRFQYVEYFGRDGTRTFREYYNLRRDPWQLINLLRDASEGSGPSRARLRVLHRRLAIAGRCAGTGCP